MLKKRIIPVILMREGRIVQSRLFSRYNIIGDPTPAVERISSWSSDELIYLDITDRNDPYAHVCNFDSLITSVAKKCSVPLAFGGGISSIEDAARCLKLGADKVTLNTAAINNSQLISEIATEFGSQCVVVSIDIKINAAGIYEVYTCGRYPTGLSPVEFALKVQVLGAGEILLNSVDRDGSGTGFDLDLINQVGSVLNIPVIALGGAGTWQDFADVLSKTNVSAVAAANIFQHSENSVYQCKDVLFKAGFPVRRPLPLSAENVNL
jgi:imidazole glycerol-phosphate synthase subunit HisF